MEEYFSYFRRVSPYLLQILAGLLMTAICSTVFRSANSTTLLILIISHMIGFLHSWILGFNAGDPWDLVWYETHMTEFIFFPPIIFEYTMSLEFQDLKRFSWQVFILLCPCFLLSLLLLGFCLFPYYYATIQEQITLPLVRYRHLFVVSGYLSTTDPIPVFAILKDLHVSGKVATLLKIEALLGQPVAVFFNDLVRLFTTDVSTLSEVLEDVAGMVGCVIAGYVYGRMLGWLVGSVLYVDYVAEIGITLTMLYACYATALLLKSSGILCIFIFGLTFNTCRGEVSRRTYDGIRLFWGTAGYCAAMTLVYLTSFASARLISLTGRTDVYFYGCYPFVFLARFCSILIMTPVLRYAGGFELDSTGILILCGVRGLMATVPLFRKFATIYSQPPSRMNLDTFLVTAESLNVVFLVGAMSHLFQGFFAIPIIKWLRLQSSRGLPRFMRSLENRINGIMKQKIMVRKEQGEHSHISWDFIERAMVFDFGSFSEDKKVEEAKTKSIASGSSRRTMEEIEARRRVQRCYEVQVRKMWQSYGYVSVAASRALGNAISEAADNRCALDVEKLFDHLQPPGIWRRLATLGRRFSKRPWIQRVLGYLSIYETFWRWRMFVCALNIASAAFMIYASIHAHSTEIDSHSFFYGSLCAFLLSMEQAIRLHHLIKIFHRSVGVGRLKMRVWFWLETSLLVVGLGIDTFHMAFIWGNCFDNELYFVFLETAYCHGIIDALIVADSLILLQFPLLFGLLLRLAVAEMENYVQNRDEETFEAFFGLLTGTNFVMRLLAGKTLVQGKILKRKLIQECVASRNAIEAKLVELLNRKGGTAVVKNIKTQQAAHELVQDTANWLNQDLLEGRLRKFEFRYVETKLDDIRVLVQSIGRQEMVEVSQATVDESLAMCLQRMDWVKAAGGPREIMELSQRLKSAGRFRQFTKKATIFSQGETAAKRGVFILLSGFCRSASCDAAVEDERLSLIHAGMIIGINGLFGEPYFDTVTVASQNATAYWIDGKVFSTLSKEVQTEFDKYVVEEACVHHLWQMERFRSWTDEMLYSYVHRMLKIVQSGTIVLEQKPVVLIKGTLVDTNGKRYTANPGRPLRISTPLTHPFKVPSNCDLAYYSPSHTGDGRSTPVTNMEELEKSFLLFGLESVSTSSPVTPGQLSIRHAASKPALPSSSKLKKNQ